MKYLIVITLALVNFALQAKDHPSVEKQVLVMDFSVSPSVGVAVDAHLAKSTEVSVGPMVPNERTFASHGTNMDVSASSPAFIWIFGSLIFGLFALASGRIFKNQRE